LIAAIYLFVSSSATIQATLRAHLKKLYTLSIFFIVGTTGAHALGYSKLARDAGLNHKTMKEIVKKVVRTESRNGSYHARNKKSGAYGRYQILPSTARYYAKKLRIPYSQWKRPRNQDRIFQAILRDNILSLKRNNIKVNAFTIYGAHQQGSNGFKAIIKNKKLTKKLERNLRRNLPRHLQKVHRKKLRAAWMRYWKKRFS
jgi:hypothetical protein